MAEDRHIYGEVQSPTSLKQVFRAIRRDVKQAQARPGLTELYKRARYLITLTHAPSTVLLGCYTLLCLPLVWLSSAAQAATPEHIFAQAAPSVVVVEVLDTQGKVTAQGSGVVTGPGMVVTACHVAQAGQRLRVWHAHTPFAATVSYAAPERDLCQVRTPRLQAPSAARGSIKTLAVGQPVYIISAPQGLDLTFTAGIISALRPVLGSYLIQTDAAVSPGSSGGGLFDRAGRLIGMPAFQLVEGQRLNFALPVDWVLDIAQGPTRKAEYVPSSGATPLDWEQRAAVLRTKKDWPGLVRLGQQWLRSEPENMVAWETLGEAYSHLGQHGKALAARRKVVYSQPENAEAWYNLGETYSELGHHRKARVAFQKAFRLRPLPPSGVLVGNFDDAQHTR